MSIVEMLLATNQVDVASEDSFSRTPLGWAAAKGHIAMIQQLLSTGEHDIEFRDGVGRTLLSYAARQGRVSMVQFLLSRGASDTSDSCGRDILMFAAEGGHYLVVRELLARNIPTLGKKDHYGSDALSIAVRHGRTAVARILLDTGKFALDSEDRFGRSLLWWARAFSETEIEQLLLDAAKNAGLTLRQPDDLTIEVDVDSLSDFEFHEKCSICTLHLCSHPEAYHMCEICLNGNFFICHFCYKLGGRCLKDEHELVGLNCYSGPDGHSSSRRDVLAPQLFPDPAYLHPSIPGVGIWIS